MSANQNMHRGSRNYHSGLSAEAIVANHYLRNGHTIAAERWRGTGGEIDLVVEDGVSVVFIEVKAARCFGQAAERLSERQMARLYAAGAEFLGRLPTGQNTEARFDVALVDAVGRVQVLENALMM